MKLILPTIALASGIFLTTIAHSRADVAITQVDDTEEWDITFDPITFTTNANTGIFAWLVFEDFYSANSTDQGDWISGTIELTVNGSTVSHTPVFRNGTFDQELGGIDANDLFLNIASSGPDLPAGTEVTVSTVGVRFSSTDVPAVAEGPFDVAFWTNGLPRPIRTNIVSVDRKIIGTPELPAVNQFEIASATGEITLTWNSLPETNYAIEISNDLVTWGNLVASVPSQGLETTYQGTGLLSDEEPAQSPTRFYRIRLNE